MKAKSTINGVFEEKESYRIECVGALFFEKFQTSNTVYDEEEGEYEEFFLQKEAKSMHKKHKENTHMRPIQEGNVAIT